MKHTHNTFGSILKHFHHLTNQIHSRELHSAFRRGQIITHVIHHIRDLLRQTFRVLTSTLATINKKDKRKRRKYLVVRNLIIRRTASKNTLEERDNHSYISFGGEAAIGMLQSIQSCLENQCGQNRVLNNQILITNMKMKKKMREKERVPLASRQMSHLVRG